MNLRTILLSGVVLLALVVTFGFKPKATGPGPVSVFLSGVCTNVGFTTNEPICSETGTGPQCTVTVARYPAYKFEATTTPSCSVPLREPF